jgi:DNA-binding response OmpR family regulator
MWLFGTKAHQVSSNAVGVYMRRVRRKVEVNPDQPRYILTVHGRGYRFNPVVSS